MLRNRASRSESGLSLISASGEGIVLATEDRLGGRRSGLHSRLRRDYLGGGSSRS